MLVEKTLSIPNTDININQFQKIAFLTFLYERVLQQRTSHGWAIITLYVKSSSKLEPITT